MTLEAFTRRPSWGVRELASELGISKSAMHRMLQELSAEGLLHADEGGTYVVAAGMLRLGSLLVRSLDLAEIATPYLAQLRDDTGETAILLAYSHDRHQFAAIAAAESPSPTRYIWEALEDWSDLHLGASGKGILAFLDQGEQDAILAALPEAIPGPKSITKRQLHRDLAAIRARGWASSVGERYPGARGVCAPVLDASGVILGAIVVGWPDRGDESRTDFFGESCRRAADALSKDLGYDRCGRDARG